MDAVARLLELDDRCRKALLSPDFAIRRQFARIQLEIYHLRIRHPDALGKLQHLYSEAHPEHIITTGRLISFAYERNLRLNGEPYPS